MYISFNIGYNSLKLLNLRIITTSFSYSMHHAKLRTKKILQMGKLKNC